MSQKTTEIQVFDPQGEVTVELQGYKGNVVAGGNGHDGDVVLLDENNQARMILEAYDASIELKDVNEEIVLRAEGEKADIWSVANVEPQPLGQLPDLDEVATFFAINGHLPGIPSYEEFSKEGIWHKEFTFQLLSKVEELTRYLISQDQEIRELKRRIKF